MANQPSRNIVVRIFLRIVRFIRNYFIFIGVLTTLVWVGIIAMIYMGPKIDLDTGPSITLSKEHPSPLRMVLAGKIAEHEPGLTDLLYAHFLGGDKAIYLPELRLTLRRAARDERISELQISLLPLMASAANYSELRRIIADFRELSGKPVRFYLAAAQDWGYYLASAGSSVVLNPAGEVSLPGPTFQLVYFGDAIKKLGLDIDVVRAGKYKSAFEPFIANKPTEPTLEEYRSLQKSLLDHIVTAVAKGRGKDEEVVRGWYRQSLFTNADAVKAGVIDAVGYPPVEHPKADKEGVSGDIVSLDDYSAATRKDKNPQESVTDKGGIALIEAVGEISLSGASPNPSREDGISPHEIHKELRWALTDDDVKAVVLRISSPGGSATASDMIWNDVKAVADAKPLIVSMGAYAASGGYYIAAPARQIVAEPTTITGSIGVIGMLPSAHAFEEKWGISFHLISSSDRREMLNIGSKATPEDKALVEKSIDEVYKTFLQRVADGRHMPAEKVAALAQGRVYTGLQGKDLGLVDEIGGLQAAFSAAKRLAGFDVNKLYPILHYEDNNAGLSECLRHLSPSRLMQCLKRGNTHISLPPLVYGLDQLPATDLVARRLEAWIAGTREEHALLLWPGYLSSSLK